MRETLTARLAADLRVALEGWPEPVIAGSGPDGAIYAAARRSTDYLVVRWREGETRSLVVPGLGVEASFVQPFANGVLLAAARCHWRPEGAEKNAVAVDWSGKTIDQFTLGDGIQDLRVTSDGTIWVSYFDEGVFGNYGWQEPMGMSGLVSFAKSGERRFAYDSGAARTDDICDAYAMNVAGPSDVWVYFYTEFPIVRILDGSYHVWKLGHAGSRALAVHQDHALLFSDYEHRSVAYVIELRAGGKAKKTGKIEVATEHGEPLGDAYAWGMGSALYFYQERCVYRLDMG
jgi:hypothetical protein